MTNEIKIHNAAMEFITAYGNHLDDRYLTSKEKRSNSLKAHYANKRLYKILGFDMGRLWELTQEQKEIREQVYNKVNEIKNTMDI